MIIRGSGIVGGGSGAALFYNHQQPIGSFFLKVHQLIRSFFENLSTGPEHFLKSSATDLKFFWNYQQLQRIFFKKAQHRDRTFF